MENIDITKISLSQKELRELRLIEKKGPVELNLIHSDKTLSRLLERGLLMTTHSDKFPYLHLEGVWGNPCNALVVSDAGHQYINRVAGINRDNLITRIIAVTALLLSALSLLLQFFRG